MAVDVRVFRGSRLLARGITKSFMPDRLELAGERLLISRKKFFGLKKDEEEIRLERIASVRVKKGFLVGRLVIETAGGAIGDIEFSQIWKWQANKIAKAIREAL